MKLKGIYRNDIDVSGSCWHSLNLELSEIGPGIKMFIRDETNIELNLNGSWDRTGNDLVETGRVEKVGTFT